MHVLLFRGREDGLLGSGIFGADAPLPGMAAKDGIVDTNREAKASCCACANSQEMQRETFVFLQSRAVI